MLKENKKIILMMNDGVECGEFNSLKDAYLGLQDIKRSDKEEKICGNTYYFELQEETKDTLYTQCIKIYKRGNKIFAKQCEYPNCY